MVRSLQAVGDVLGTQITFRNPKGETETFPVYTSYDKERQKITFNTLLLTQEKSKLG